VQRAAVIGNTHIKNSHILAKILFFGMKALIKTKPQSSYEYTTVPKPVPQSGEVLMKVEKVSICGSDIPLYKWDSVGQKIAQIPFTPGHECTGTVCVN
jgi:threonine 3-dehydrogenase